MARPLRAARLRSLAMLVTMWTIACVGASCSSPKEGNEDSTSHEPARYVGRQACTPCHEKAVSAWTGSHHDLAMQPADETTVLGDFDDATLTYNGVTSRFFREGDAYRVRTDGSSGELEEFTVSYTFGVEPLQQYLIEFPDGKLQVLGLCWDTRPADSGGQRWFHIYPGEEVDHEDLLHWTGPLQNWNYMCSECHSTNVRKNYTAATDSYETGWSEIDVSCEACHGPGSAHLEWARRAAEGSGDTEPGMGLAVDLSNTDGGAWLYDEGAVSAHREPPRRSHIQVEACARCHSRRTQLTDDYVHGRPLADTHRVALLDEGLYHADGQILDEVYVYGSFLQSKMHHEGVTCSDCHDPHTADLRLEGNATCSPCHRPDHFDTPEHTFHAADSTGASCVACHMTERDYMVVDPRRDHGFRVPRPDLSVTLGTPNTCNDCHADKDAVWAATHVASWFPDGRSGEPHPAEAIHAAREGRADAGPALVALVSSDDTPAITRATALDLLRTSPAATALEAVSASLDDPDPLVRRAAVGTLELAPPPVLLELGLPLLDDPALSVRIEAARALGSIPRTQLAPGQRDAIDRGLDEYGEAQRFNADRAEGRLNLGWLHLQRGAMQGAERAYREAAAMAHGASAPSLNLADLYRMQGRETDAEKILRDALGDRPDDADLLHALGLALVRQKRHDEALPLLERATTTAPQNPRYAYVYGVALHSLGRKQRALAVLEAAHERHPADLQTLTMLVEVSRETGDAARAIRYARELLELAPGHPGASRLLQELGAAPSSP